MKPLFPFEPVGGEGLLPTGKHGGRDSIRSKVFEEGGKGDGGRKGETWGGLPPSPESFPLPSTGVPLLIRPLTRMASNSISLHYRVL